MICPPSELSQNVDATIKLYDDAKSQVEGRDALLRRAVDAASQYWDGHCLLAATLTELQHSLNQQDPVALDPMVIRDQQDVAHVSIGFAKIC